MKKGISAPKRHSFIFDLALKSGNRARMKFVFDRRPAPGEHGDFELSFARPLTTRDALDYITEREKAISELRKAGHPIVSLSDEADRLINLTANSQNEECPGHKTA